MDYYSVESLNYSSSSTGSVTPHNYEPRRGDLARNCQETSESEASSESPIITNARVLG